MNSRHEPWMNQALALAEKGRPWTSPNPLVGAVIVKKNRLISSGYHTKFGAPHAEIEAIQKAGSRAKGSTLYVTLEPCSTFGKTPPCTESIKRSGIKQVIIGATDPNPAHHGRGISFLKKNHIRVTKGILEKEVLHQNEAYVKWITKKVPFVILKMAQSLDGKIASRTGNSRWISGRPAREWVHHLRSKVDAILIGKNTMLKDNPRLTVRNSFPLNGGRLASGSTSRKARRGWGLSPHLNPPPQGGRKWLQRNGATYLLSSSIVATWRQLNGGNGEIKPPWRIVLDPKGESSPSAQIFKQNGPVLLACSEDRIRQVTKKYSNQGITLLPLKTKGGKLNLLQLLHFLGSMGISSLLVEGGGELAASFIEQGLVDQVKWILAPKIIGGRDAKTSVEGTGVNLLSRASRIKSIRMSQLGEDFLLEGYVA